MKKFFEYFGLATLVCFSFFLTEKTATVVEEMDEIMVQIKSHQTEYQEEGMDATITGPYIVPGLPKKTINVEKSYQKMKELGTYDEDYFVWDLEKPKINLDNHLEKYVVSGNPTNRVVSLVVLLNQKNLSSLLESIGNEKVSYLLDEEEFEKNKESIPSLIASQSEFLLKESGESEFLSLRQKLSTYHQESFICYNPKQDDAFSSLCQKYSYHSITTNQEISKNPLKMTKELLAPGAFLVYEVNPKLLEELPNILSYIKSHGYEIVPVSSQLKED